MPFYCKVALRPAANNGYITLLFKMLLFKVHRPGIGRPRRCECRLTEQCFPIISTLTKVLVRKAPMSLPSTIGPWKLRRHTPCRRMALMESDNKLVGRFFVLLCGPVDCLRQCLGTRVACRLAASRFQRHRREAERHRRETGRLGAADAQAAAATAAGRSGGDGTSADSASACAELRPSNANPDERHVDASGTGDNQPSAGKTHQRREGGRDSARHAVGTAQRRIGIFGSGPRFRRMLELRPGRRDV